MSKERETENFVSLGTDLKVARKVLGLSRRTLAEMVNIDPHYLVNSENSSVLPSLPVFYQLEKKVLWYSNGIKPYKNTLSGALTRYCGILKKCLFHAGLQGFFMKSLAAFC